MSKKCKPLWCEAHFQVKMVRSTCPSENAQNTQCWDHFWKLRCRKSKSICKDRFPVASAIRETCSSEMLGGPGADFLRTVAFCILEHQTFSFAEMILRDRCSTSYDLAPLFGRRRSTLDRWSGKIAKRIGTRPSALHSTFHVCNF